MLKVASGLAGAGSLNYQGTWNASSNVPFLQSGVGVKGYYYLVSVAGSTNLDGITNWQVNDWAVFDGTRWEKVDNNNSVISVNGQTGVVVLTAANVGATPNTTYVVAGTGLSGGGQLTGNVTLNLANTAVTAGTYGNASSVSQITVDAQGRITNAANVSISIPGMGTVTNVATGTGLTGGPITTTGTISIANTTVTSGSYGNASTVAVFTVNAQGQLTAASNSSIAINVAAVSGAVPNTVNVIAGTNLTGGGALTGNVTINNPYNGTVTNVATGTGLTGGPITSSGTISLANTAVTAGSYGNASTVGSFTVDAQGRLTSASNTAISISVAAVSGAVPNTRNISTSTGLSGGGNLSADLTLSVTPNTTQQLVTVQNNGTAVGTRQVHNFIPGTNITITSADDSSNGRANITISTSGLGTMATQNANSVTITGGTINGVSLTLDSINNTPLGNITPSTANVTTLNASGNVVLGAYTGYVYANGSGANVTASTTIPTSALSGTITNAQLANSSITVNGTSISLGNSGAVTANTTGTLTISTGLSGTSFNGSSNVTITNTGVTSFNTRNGAVTLTSSDVTTALGYTPGTGNGSVTSITAGTGLNGGTITTSGTINLANTTVVAASYGSAAIVPTFTVNAQGQLTAASNATISIPASAINSTIPNSGLANSTATLGNATITLGSTTSTVGNLTLNNVTINSGNVAVTYANAAYHIATGNIAANTSAGVFSYGNLSYSDIGIVSSYANSANNSVQIVLQNTSSANNASSDFVVVNDTGSAYLDYGVTSSTFTGTGKFYSANSAYVYSGSADLYVGTISNNALHFVTNNSTTDAMVINANNTVTINSLAQSTSTTATFATPSLPLVPAGYFSVNLNGTVVKVPYYAV